MQESAVVSPDALAAVELEGLSKHAPKWRNAPAPVKLNKQLQDALMDVVKRMDQSAEVRPHNLASLGELDYVKVEHKIHLRRGKWRRYDPDMEQRIIESEKERG
jgi:hypothetical protein